MILLLLTLLQHNPREAIARGFELRDAGDFGGALECFEENGPPDEIAFTLYAMNEPAVDAFRAALTDDPLSLYNLAAAMHAEDMDARGMAYEALCRASPADALVPYALRLLAEYELPEHAWRLLAEADYLEERMNPWALTIR